MEYTVRGLSLRIAADGYFCLVDVDTELERAQVQGLKSIGLNINSAQFPFSTYFDRWSFREIPIHPTNKIPLGTAELIFETP